MQSSSGERSDPEGAEEGAIPAGQGPRAERGRPRSGVRVEPAQEAEGEAPPADALRVPAESLSCF